MGLKKFRSAARVPEKPTNATVKALFNDSFHMLDLDTQPVPLIAIAAKGESVILVNALTGATVTQLKDV